MSGGQACRTIGETRKPSFHADVRGLCAASAELDDAPPSSHRSEADTQPYTDAYADTLAAPASVPEGRPQWCIDTGGLMVTMSTFELWEALERGEVLAWMRVWREGMECWTPVGEIAEFAWALAAVREPEREPEALEPGADAHTGPLSTPTVTPAPPPPESAVRPIVRRRTGARWIALGSAVALVAVISALFLRRAVTPPLPLASAGAAENTLLPQERLDTTPPLPLASAGAAAPAETELAAHHASAPADPPAPEAARHDERGQRRLPRGGRRAYGR